MSYVPQSTSSRIVCLFWLLVCLLVSTYYGAGTVTALLSESKPTITTLDQLLRSKITLSPPDAPFMRDKKVRFRVFGKSVADKMDDSKLYQLDEGVQSIMNGSAFVGEFYFVYEGINRLLKSNTICDLTVFNCGPKANVVNQIRKQAHLREILMRGLLRSMEHGLVHNERQHWLVEKLLCSRVTEFIEVRLESVSVAFYVFFGGLTLSVAIFSVELYARVRSSRYFATHSSIHARIRRLLKITR